MNETLLQLSLAYVFLTALLLLCLIFSRIHWWLKAGLIVLAVIFYGFSYQGWKESQGWPTAVDLPEKFLLHFSVIEEPDKEAGTEGAIFIWLTDLKGQQLADSPRAYRLPYHQDTHNKLNEALRETRSGNLQLGFMETEDDPQINDLQANRTGQKYDGLEFRKLPDPALPEK